jgi:signal transduction histidine kinase
MTDPVSIRPRILLCLLYGEASDTRGIGLALSREITETHGGYRTLASHLNRPDCKTVLKTAHRATATASYMTRQTGKILSDIGRAIFKIGHNRRFVRTHMLKIFH